MTTRLIAVLTMVIAVAGCATNASTSQDASQAADTMRTAKAFLQAAGSGDGKTLNALMADDFFWHNEGDNRIPWIGTWRGKDAVFGQFMPAFGHMIPDEDIAVQTAHRSSVLRNGFCNPVIVVCGPHLVGIAVF